MEIAVLVKQVPDTYAERYLKQTDWTLDRAASDGVIDEITEKAVELGLQLVEKHGGEVTVVTMGPDSATDALRKAMAMGAHRAVHIVDDVLAGADAVLTSAALSAALRTMSVDLVLAGNEATDGRVGAMAGMVSERLGLPCITSAVSVEIQGSVVTAVRVVEGGSARVEASLPAVISVNEKIGDPRYPSFKGIMSAKKKPVSMVSAVDLGLDVAQGLAAGGCEVLSGSPQAKKAAGEKVVDDGNGGIKIAEFLVSQRLL